MSRTGPNYKPVPQDDTGEEIPRKKRTERLNRITAKLHALFWVVLSIFVAYKTEVVKVVLYSNKINRIALNLAVLAFSANFAIMMYLMIWIPVVKKSRIPIEISCPRLIPTATILGVLALLFYMIAFWPIWGILSPLIVLILFMGLMFLSHFIPWPFSS
jgi:hypothetical protein